MKDLISIIIPVYNVEEYLKDCLDSIRAQSYENLEIIVVDDGSTDNSSLICDEFAKIDTRFIVVHKQNGGQADARNIGVLRSTGKYLMFVDSDDVVKNTYVERLYNVLIDKNVDIVCSPYKKIYEINELLNDNESISNPIVYSNIEGLEKLLYQNKIFHTGAFGKIFKKEVWKDVSFPKGMIYEDLGTTYKILLKSNRVAGIDEHLYGYRIRKGSTMRQAYKPIKLSCIPISQELYSTISKRCPELSVAAATRCFSVNRAIFWQLSPKNKGYHDIWKEIKKYRKIVVFNKKARSKDRIMALISYLGQSIFHCFSFPYKIQQMSRVH